MILIDQRRLFLPGNYPDLNPGFCFYFPDDFRAVGCIPHGRRWTGFYVFYVIDIEKKFIALHCFNELLNFSCGDLALVKYCKTEAERCADECFFNKLYISRRTLYYIRHQKAS